MSHNDHFNEMYFTPQSVKKPVPTVGTKSAPEARAYTFTKPVTTYITEKKVVLELSVTDARNLQNLLAATMFEHFHGQGESPLYNAIENALGFDGRTMRDRAAYRVIV